MGRKRGSDGEREKQVGKNERVNEAERKKETGERGRKKG